MICLEVGVYAYILRGEFVRKGAGSMIELPMFCLRVLTWIFIGRGVMVGFKLLLSPHRLMGFLTLFPPLILTFLYRTIGKEMVPALPLP